MGAVVIGVVIVAIAGALWWSGVRVRRRVRERPSVDRSLAARPAVPPAGSDVWAAVRAGISPSPVMSPEEIDALAHTFARRVDPAESRPRLADDLELKEFHLRWGNDYALLANPRALLHYRIEPGEVEILPLLDGTRTVKQIVVERLQDSGDFELGGLADFVHQLRVGGFLDTPFIDVDAAVARGIAPESTVVTKVRGFFTTLSIEWDGADRLVRTCYRYGVRWFFHPPVLVAAALVAVVGFAAFVSVYRSGRFSISAEGAAIGSLILIGLDYVLTFLHELGHASVLVHYQRRVKNAGFMIYFGSPSFFVDASDGLMLEPRQRIAQSFAGPFAELIVAGLAAIFVALFPETSISSIVYKFALLNYFVIFLNLIPLLELDGYWILSDVIQVPDLRPRSLSFLRDDLPRKLRGHERVTVQEVGLGLYGLLGVVFTIFCLVTAAFFWRQVFGGLVSELWNGGLVGRLLLLALTVFILGPIVRGGIALGRLVFRRLRALVRRIRFRLESRWRVEAAELIDGLGTFDDLPEDVLGDLAGRVTLRSVPRGRPVVRQGERATGFYVVRRGTFGVVEEREGEGDRLLRVLGRGESFGELALVGSAPRAATVRALEEGEVFEIDKGTFDRLLAESVHVPDFGPTVQAAMELRELRGFAHLEPDELAELLEHGGWIVAAPGDEIIRQGDVGDAFYSVRSGQVEVIRDGSPVRVLGAGDYFGEIALLTDVPRTASVVATTPVRAFRLDREGFEGLVAQAFTRGTLRPHTGGERTAEH